VYKISLLFLELFCKCKIISKYKSFKNKVQAREDQELNQGSDSEKKRKQS
jgi:hypothetical protein